MILLDANLLLYAHYEDAPQHEAASSWLARSADGPHRIALTWAVVWAFVRIGSSPRIWSKPATVPELFGALEALMAAPNALFLEPGSRHLRILQRLMETHRIQGPMVSDAVLAAIAIEHDATLASTDRDFQRFDGLRWINPIAT